MLAKNKLNSIETLLSQALIDMEISHEKFIAIFQEKDVRSENEKQRNYDIEQREIKDLRQKTIMRKTIKNY